MTSQSSPARKGKGPTLASLSESQIHAIRSIPAHGNARVPKIEAHRPVSIFTGAERFRQEQDRLFRTRPVPITMSAMVPRGHVLAHDGYGRSLLITRTKDGDARIFLNACQHKGAKLVDGCKALKQSKITCPYHAWTYDLNGSLVAAARSETFENLDKSARGLAPIPCREHAGIIWAILDAATDNWDTLHPQIEEDFSAMGIPTAHVYGHRTFDLKANWKVVLEPFLEGYHVQRLHSKSIAQFFADVPTVTDVFGLSIRQISGKVNFAPDAPELADTNIHKTITHAYLVFPNCVVITSPYYISVMLLIPQGVDRTRVDYFMLTPSAPDNPKAEELYAKSYDLILSVFGGEDFWAAEMSQHGLSTGALETVVYSGLEETILTFYELLESQI